MKSVVLWEGPTHRWLVLGRDPDKREDLIDTNQCVIASDGAAMLIDPGGIEIFPRVLSELSRWVRTTDVKILFSSHQDPDVISSLAMWLDLCPQAQVYCSWLWSAFISHYCMGAAASFQTIPDEGMPITVGDAIRVEAVPAHFCHSPGNFGVWDPRAKILFSGDIGAALLPSHEASLFVENFGQHVKYMEAFHLRWMPSTTALREFVRRARKLAPEMIVPQHGSIFRGEDVRRFLDWLESLEVGKTKMPAVEDDVAA